MKTLARLLPTLIALTTWTLAACESDEASSDTPDGDALPYTCTDTGVCTLTAPLSDPITADLTLTADKQWLLTGGVFVGDDEHRTVLTIEPGTQIFGETSSKAFLTIRRGSQIMAEGTRDNCIVFTSSKSPGSRARGDWGGVVINGRAPINGCDAPPCEAQGEGGSGLYGGADPGDDSGVLRYVRVEFAGHPITEDDELNGIAFQGVGSGTTIDYVQIHMADDDGIEFFGGTVGFKHVLTTGVSDDNLDWTDGWNGKGQFFVAQQYEDTSDNGIEADNNGENNTAEPRSNPMLSNLTLIGVPTSQDSDTGILLREGTAATIHNTLVVGFNDACFDIDNAETFANAGGTDGTPTGEITIKHMLLSCATNIEMDDEKDEQDNTIPDPWSLEAFLGAMTDVQSVDEPPLEDAFDTLAPKLAPKAGSLAASGGEAPSDPFFDQVDFIGGIDPADDWTQGWTTSVRN